MNNSCRQKFKLSNHYHVTMNIRVSGKDVVKIEQVLSRELKAVNEWFEENHLSLHLRKTIYLYT